HSHFLSIRTAKLRYLNINSKKKFKKYVLQHNFLTHFPKFPLSKALKALKVLSSPQSPQSP
ncbi:MAG: hypothetical protein K2K29_07165, partial [Muribaculaceae bacterium]|nr:hypothetical protein [Muribaculaceae bacterium]